MLREKTRVAVVGFGNVGRYAIDAVQTAPDMELAGVVRRASSLNSNNDTLQTLGVHAVSDIRELENVQAAILCTPTRTIPDVAESILSLGINTVDSFDIHGQPILALRARLQAAAQENNAVAIVSAGWDPGTDSVVRTLFEAMAPFGITYTNFGPGMSMGHSTVVRTMPGVKEALSMTIPLGTGVHRRMVYVELEPDSSYEQVEQQILTDPYFAKDETHVHAVSDVGALWDLGHAVMMQRKGTSGKTANQMMQLHMAINNPALTGQILVAAARAGLRQNPGAYCLPEIAPLDFLPGDRESLIERLV
ncbi:MAG TPA: diaminopimelate dehydrogenase, partial [Firmicutes bacterium]|jgi:diaminopimelate dehydrogenase|nr:diaminopimelate dehydrogenase [Bacillota bacterium]HBL68054.1 diaminopimelate dehydrogenase [Bacillota bacterium]HCX71458.1 diaminopimelate dehydrogenase [Bacillota bacterium]